MKTERVRQTAAKVLYFDNGDEVLMSYNTPVAGYKAEPSWQEGKYFRTDTTYSVTTSRHIHEYLRKHCATGRVVVRTQAAINLMLEVNKNEDK